VIKERLIGYFDCREAHNCPLQPHAELRNHLAHIHGWWTFLLERRDLLVWAEDIGKGLVGRPIVSVPDTEVTSYGKTHV
jgi:hypothetical protein